MRKFQIIATRDLQIDGLSEPAAGDSVLGTIETDCNVGSLISCLEHRNARLVEVDADGNPIVADAKKGAADASETEAEKPKSSRKSKSSSKPAAK